MSKVSIKMIFANWKNVRIFGNFDKRLVTNSIYFIFTEVFYLEPQPERGQNDKLGYCGVEENQGQYYQNCKCETIKTVFYEFDMPNFCKMLCNYYPDCEGYTPISDNSCRYYTSNYVSTPCATLSLDANYNVECKVENIGNLGTIVSMRSGNEKGCYIKSPINYFDDEQIN